MRWPRRALVDVLAAVGVAAATWLAFGHAFLNYDTFYALLWGSDVVHGRLPQYGVPFAPTPHPLVMAIGAAVSPLGDRAEEALLGIGLLGLGALVVGLLRLGQALFGTAVGLVAAVLILTRVPILSYGIRGYVDLPAVALVVWAAVLEARERRRGAPVLALLALAGLLRPEFWLFSAAYWAWIALPLGWGRRLTYAALALAAPALWALSDLLVTGDPLWSLHGTGALADRLQRPTGLAVVPRVLPFRLGEILRLPELIAAVLGLGVALRWFRDRVGLPVAVAALNGMAYLAFAAAELPLLGRYLFTASSMLALFVGVAAVGWLGLARDAPGRGALRVLGAVVLVVLAVFAPTQLGRLAVLRADIAARDRIQADLRDLVERPAALTALRGCGPVFAPTHRPTPQIAYWTGLRPLEVHSAGLERPPAGGGAFIAAATPQVAQLGLLDPRDPTPAGLMPPLGYRPVARNRSWVLLARCGGG